MPKEVRDAMTFVPVDELSEVLYQALGKRVISPVPLGADGKASNVVPLRAPAGHEKRLNGVIKRRPMRKNQSSAKLEHRQTKKRFRVNDKRWP